MREVDLSPLVILAFLIYLMITISLFFDPILHLVLVGIPYLIILAMKKVLRKTLRSSLSVLGFLAPALFMFNMWYYPNMYPIYSKGYEFWLIPNYVLLTLDGFSFGLQTAIRICFLFSFVAFITEILPVQELIEIFERVHLPTSVSLATSVGLSYAPTMLRTFENIKEAQQARAWRVKTRNPVRKARAWTPLLIPTVKAAIRDSEMLAAAIESRGYTREATLKASRKKIKLSKIDITFISCFIVVIIFALYYGKFGKGLGDWRFTSNLVKDLLNAL